VLLTGQRGKEDTACDAKSFKAGQDSDWLLPPTENGADAGLVASVNTLAPKALLFFEEALLSSSPCDEEGLVAAGDEGTLRALLSGLASRPRNSSAEGLDNDSAPKCFGDDALLLMLRGDIPR